MNDSSLIDFLNEGWKIFTLFLMQYAMGKRGSFPYGVVLHFSLMKIALLVILADIIQTVIILFLFEASARKFSWMQSVKARLGRYQHKQEQKKWYQKFGGWGLLGIFLISSLPQGGGALTGSILAIGIQAKKTPAIIAISLGCIISDFLFYAAFRGLLNLPFFHH